MTKITKVWCDYCQKEYSPDKITCQLQYVVWNKFKKEVRPEGISKDYCTFCQDKIIKAIEDLRIKEVKENADKEIPKE